MSAVESVLDLLQRRQQGPVDEKALVQVLVVLIEQWLSAELSEKSPRTWVGSVRGIIINLERRHPELTDLLDEEDVRRALVPLLREGILEAPASEDRDLHGSPTLYIARSGVRA